MIVIAHLIRRVVGMLMMDTRVLMFHHRPNVVVGVGGGGGVGREVVVVAYLLLLLDLLHQDGLLLVLAAFVLEPDADDARRQSSHLHQLLLHKGVGTRVGRVASAQRVQLFLVQHRPHPSRLAVRAAAAAARDAGPTDAAYPAISFTIARSTRPLAAFLPRRRRYASIGTVCLKLK